MLTSEMKSRIIEGARKTLNIIGGDLEQSYGKPLTQEAVIEAVYDYYGDYAKDEEARKALYSLTPKESGKLLKEIFADFPKERQYNGN